MAEEKPPVPGPLPLTPAEARELRDRIDECRNAIVILKQELDGHKAELTKLLTEKAALEEKLKASSVSQSFDPLGW